MNLYVLIYDGYAHFEADLIGWMKGRSDKLVTVSLGGQEIHSAEGFIMKPHVTIDEVDANDVDAFIVPGGDSPSILGNEKLQELLKKLDEKNILIGAICYGPLLLGESGILKERKFTTTVTSDLELFNTFEGGKFVDEGVVVDGHIVTAKGEDYVDFALTVCRLAQVSNENNLNYWANFFRSKELVNQG
ncbi:DJ-1/PfpI family protein [Bacillus sp. S/N-304-OC-R1]|uniref:DJ-1/PfpI family protein n=1 Tax=Bacillus sp. S/N-304-OC-R1 TaxID=2758034 RepID=UPI001C8E33CF|nr:DJ-1/PfpI family protein [Bacillus sp. S/N-304-OC-R1]MBY0123583.1 DJ-1/PfpI family protein [Bacillus sp. S/N-304-OC-R1]